MLAAILLRGFRLATWRETAYLVLGGAIAIVAFCVLVTGLSVGLALLITLIGIPVLVLTAHSYSRGVAARPKRNWIQEERRKTLGDWVAFCLTCGHTLRYFEDFEAELPAACPECSGELRSRCPACDARFPSAFAVECEECGAEVRPNELFGSAIRRAGR